MKRVGNKRKSLQLQEVFLCTAHQSSLKKFANKIKWKKKLKNANFSTIVKQHFASPKILLWKKNIIEIQNQGLLYKKVGSKDIWNFWKESWVNLFGKY